MYKIRMMLLMLVVVLCLCSCATEKSGAVSVQEINEQVNTENYTVSVYEDGFKFSFEESNDNWLKISDCYSESILGKGARLFYGMNTPEGFVSETIFVDESGNIDRKNLTNEGRSTFLVGSVAGSDRFVALTCEYSAEPIIRIETREPSGSLVDERRIDFLNENSEYKGIALDQFGYAHLLLTDEDTSNDLQYYLVDNNGKAVYSQSFDKNAFIGFIATSDNALAYDIISDVQSATHEVYTIDEDTLKPKLLLSYSDIAETPIMALNIIDSENLIFMDEKGVYKSDFKFEKIEKVFDWKSNGIRNPSIQKASSVKMDKAGNIYAFVGDYGNQTFLVLKKGDTGIRTIKLAVMGDSDFYAEAVSGFNRTHPNTKVTIEHYKPEDKTSFFTEMIAGEAPVLIDSGMFSLEEVTDYLEPLDDLLETVGADAISESVKMLGNVDGSTYAMAADCYIDTLASDIKNKDWDYRAFLNSLTESKQIESIYNNYWNLGKAYVAACFFDNGHLDSLYFEDDGRTPKFCTDEVKKVIELVDKYGDDNAPQSFIDGLKAGTMLCERIQIKTPKELIAFHNLYGDKIALIGYPGKEGARHYLCSNNLITVLKKAPKEDKDVASEFVKYIISYDLQENMALKGQRIFFNFSVRNDVIRQQVEAITAEEYVVANFTPTDYRIPKEIDIEAVIEEIATIMEKATVRHDSSSEYGEILYEEFYDYYDGKISIDELIRNLESRLKIYLMERE